MEGSGAEIKKTREGGIDSSNDDDNWRKTEGSEEKNKWKRGNGEEYRER